jgi:hypothetical protein
LVDIIIRNPQPGEGTALPNDTGITGVYDPRIAQDHTGVKFSARPRRGPKSGDPLTDARVLMSRPKELRCPECNGTEFRILADDSADASSGLIQISCSKRQCCLFPILQVGQPQVNDILAKRLGLLLPGPGLKFDLTLGDDDD